MRVFILILTKVNKSFALTVIRVRYGDVESYKRSKCNA